MYIEYFHWNQLVTILPLEKEEVYVVVVLCKKITQNAVRVATLDLVGRQAKVDTLYKIPKLSHRISVESPVWQREGLTHQKKNQILQIDTKCIGRHFFHNKYYTLDTSLWHQGGWRTSKSVSQTPVPPGKHTSPAGTSSDRGPGPQSWCQTGWAAWRGRPPGPGLLTETPWCQPPRSISEQPSESLCRLWFMTGVFFKKNTFDKNQGHSPQTPSIHRWWRWSWRHRWGTWWRIRRTRGCTQGGWCRRKTVWWAGKREGLWKRSSTSHNLNGYENMPDYLVCFLKE